MKQRNNFDSLCLACSSDDVKDDAKWTPKVVHLFSQTEIDQDEGNREAQKNLGKIHLDSDEAVDKFRCHLVSVLAESAPWSAKICLGQGVGGADRAWTLAVQVLGEAEDELLVESLRWIGSMAKNSMWPSKINVRLKKLA